MKKIAALIMAAGNSVRFGGQIPKLHMPLGSQTVLGQTLHTYLTHPQIDFVQLVGNAGHGQWLSQLPAHPKFVPWVYGGQQRAESVLKGLQALAPQAPDYVLIADGARPFTDHNLITRVIEVLGNFCVLPALSLPDTLKEVDGNNVLSTIDRQYLLAAQTPQAFPFAKILALHQSNEDPLITDDAGLFENAGLPVKSISGDRRNFKITTMEDYEMAVQITSQTQLRIGQGFDIHRFKAGDHIMLGGVRVPHTHGVEAHSDGDVILDALTDAILGAIGAGDIGQHFPPADMKWQNADSAQFVQHAMQLLQARGGRIINADITLLAELPKLAPHRASIQQKLSEMLAVEPPQINLKAKTLETMGALGRQEGLAAQTIILCEIKN